MPPYRSRTTTHGRNMAGARGLWRATGMKDGDFGKPIIAVVNSFTQFVPGHVHLKDLGQLVAREIEAAGGVAKEFNTIAVDDGIAMGHDGMLYSLPSREIIADSVEYMVNAHCADAMVCISNCDKITPGMLNAAMRLNIPAVFVSGGPMEAGKAMLKGKLQALDLVDAMVMAADDSYSDEEIATVEEAACPTCGSCSGMFTANSMNCLTEALGLSLPGNGSTLATHSDRKRLFVEAGHLIVDLARRYYEQDDETALPRTIATKAAFENAMALDIAMGGSTNTVLHILAAAHEGGIDFTMDDIDALSRKVPVLCKVAPAKADVHMEDVHRAGGIMAILGQLDRAGLINREEPTVHALTMGDALDQWDISRTNSDTVRNFFMAAPGGVRTTQAFSQSNRWAELDLDRQYGRHPRARKRLLQGWRACRAQGQHRARRLHREDRRRRRVDPEVHRTGARLRKPGRHRQGDPVERDQGRRRHRHPLRGTARRPRHAGNALSDELPEGEGPRKGLRAGHRRALFGRHVRPVDRPRLAGSRRGRRHRPGARGRHGRDRHPEPHHQPRGLGRGTGDAPRRAGRRRLEARRQAQAQRHPGAARLRRLRHLGGARRRARGAGGVGSPGLAEAGRLLHLNR